ncbi:Dabb family protein [Aquimarina algicola]|uniref:Dabb family protein n=1 Tax=Aquimarina algicola TaxID=2589995 RepID=A0A504JE03_9FLAO|nr:Dabb family protein [Aquimarina algicola]TPN89057.1 Dabb family protein [Aquimarina algicola]
MKYSVFIIACLISISSFAQAIEDTKEIKGNLVHNVFFWLKNPDNQTERKAFEKGVKDLLSQCKFITSSHIGSTANTAKRDVVDASFTYCVVITFDSKEAHDNYQVDPLHKKFIKENEMLWSKVLVYDSQKLK